MHYLDFAATSAVRPESVARAVLDFLTTVGASPGRGGHERSLEAGRVAFRCRRRLAQLLGIPGDPGRIVFTTNATQALNTVLYGLLSPADTVVITAYDHNSVLRPVDHLARTRGVRVRMLSGAPDGSLDLDELDRVLEGARLLVINQASNVLGTCLPVREMASRARRAGVMVLVDAAQSAGHLPVRPGEDEIDFLALTGHKGMLGPQGIGALWIRDGIELDPLIAGGTGGNSEAREMPHALPDRFEAGTPNMPGIAGLLAGLDHILEDGVEAAHRREQRLKARLRDGLLDIPTIRVLSPAAPDGVGIVTITSSTVDPGTLGKRLEREWGVLSRSGLHCAPEVHRILGTLETGAVRLSLGWASTEEDVDRAIQGIEAIAGPARVSLSTS